MIDDGTVKTGTITGEIIGRTEQMIRDAQTATSTLKDIITEEYEAIQTAAEDMHPRASSVVYEPYKSPVQQASAAENIVSALGEQLSKIKVVLDDGTLVGHMMLCTIPQPLSQILSARAPAHVLPSPPNTHTHTHTHVPAPRLWS